MLIAAAVVTVADEVENYENGNDQPDIAVVKNVAKAVHMGLLLPSSLLSYYGGAEFLLLLF